MLWKKITRVKNISNKETGRAYLDDLEKEFILHYPDRFRNSINNIENEEIIVLYQMTPKKGSRYLTHLVKPIDKEIIETGERDNYKFGQIVKTLAFTTENNMIPINSTNLKGLNFRNRGWGNAQKLVAMTGEDQLEVFQKHIWNLFKPFMNPNLNSNIRNYESFFNDELNVDFESNEGKLQFRLHRIRERDSKLTRLKKQNAIKAGNYKCEVCNFSFIEFYDEEYLECHHKIPINEGERITKLEDLALVCANCHRMLHRKIDGKYLSVHNLKERLINR